MSNTSICDYVLELENKYYFLWESLLRVLRGLEGFLIIDVNEEKKILKFKRELHCYVSAINIPQENFPKSIFSLWLDNNLQIGEFNYYRAHVDSVRSVLYSLQKLPRIMDSVNNGAVKSQYNFFANTVGGVVTVNLTDSCGDISTTASIGPLDHFGMGMCFGMTWFDELVIKDDSYKWAEACDGGDDGSIPYDFRGNIFIGNWLKFLDLANIWNSPELKCVLVVLGDDDAIKLCMLIHQNKFNKNLLEIYVDKFLEKLRMV